jgi:hypothetical protein
MPNQEEQYLLFTVDDIKRQMKEITAFGYDWKEFTRMKPIDHDNEYHTKEFVTIEDIGLDDLNNVNTINKVNGQVLVWDSTSQKWVNMTMTGGGEGSITFDAVSKAFTASQGQTEYDISDIYDDGYLAHSVYRNGVYQLDGLDYTFNTLDKKVVFNYPCNANDIIVVILNTSSSTISMTAHGHGMAEISGLINALNSKAPLDSPTFTGTITLNGVLGSALNVGNNNVYFANTNNVPTAGMVTVDWRRANIQKISLNGNTTVSFVNPNGNSFLILHIQQDSVGNRSIALPSIRTKNGDPLEINMTSNGSTVLWLYYDGSVYYGGNLQ